MVLRHSAESLHKANWSLEDYFHSSVTLSDFVSTCFPTLDPFLLEIPIIVFLHRYWQEHILFLPSQDSFDTVLMKQVDTFSGIETKYVLNVISPFHQGFCSYLSTECPVLQLTLRLQTVPLCRAVTEQHDSSFFVDGQKLLLHGGKTNSKSDVLSCSSCSYNHHAFPPSLSLNTRKSS